MVMQKTSKNYNNEKKNLTEAIARNMRREWQDRTGALARVVQWAGHHPANQKLACSIPGQGTHLG